MKQRPVKEGWNVVPMSVNEIDETPGQPSRPVALDYKEILLQLMVSLTCCEHMGDVSNDMLRVLKSIGLEPPPDILVDDCSLARWLAGQGITKGL